MPDLELLMEDVLRRLEAVEGQLAKATAPKPAAVKKAVKKAL